MAEPRWRVSRFGDNWELVKRRPGGGDAIWYGTVGPVIRGECRYNTPHGCGKAVTQDEAKIAVDELASQHSAQVAGHG